MTFRDLYRRLTEGKYHVFSSDDLLLLSPDQKKEAIKKAVSRWRDRGWIRSLKKGLYELAYPRDLVIPDLYIANRIYEPSYVSLETALSHYSIIPEVSMAVTSITTKPTRRFKNSHGLFLYRTVKPRAFTGYYIETVNLYSVFIAEPEKAVADFFYFKTYRGKSSRLSGERLDKASLSKLNKRKLTRYLKLYNLKIRDFHDYI